MNTPQIGHTYLLNEWTTQEWEKKTSVVIVLGKKTLDESSWGSSVELYRCLDGSEIRMIPVWAFNNSQHITQ